MVSLMMVIDTSILVTLTCTSASMWPQNCTGVRNTIRRIVQALQWYSDKKENPGEGFKVESDSVTLEGQKNAANADPGADPHKGLKDVLPVSDRLTMMDYIYGDRADWGPASVTSEKESTCIPYALHNEMRPRAPPMCAPVCVHPSSHVL
jgi:hypothetical protein